MLASQDECEIAKEMPSQGKDVCSEIVKRSVDKGNLFVLEVELILFLRRGICLETLQTKIDFSFLI